jgi:hypothetical protein
MKQRENYCERRARVTQPFDNRDWDLRAESERLKDKIRGLEKLNQMTDEEVVLELKAEIERLTNVIRATEMERDAGDKVSNNLRAQIERLKALLTRAADALECHNHDRLQDGLIAELRKAAQ